MKSNNVSNACPSFLPSFSEAHICFKYSVYSYVCFLAVFFLIAFVGASLCVLVNYQHSVEFNIKSKAGCESHHHNKTGSHLSKQWSIALLMVKNSSWNIKVQS